MLMPRPGSAENFGMSLAGRWDTENLPPADRHELEQAKKFAAQRLVLRDEISGLFKSFGRDFMAGLREDLLEMYDAPRTNRVATNSRGIIIARDIAPCLIGASTPFAMASALSDKDWQDGTLARFVLVTPEPDFHDRTPNDSWPDNTWFVEFLAGLHRRLPEPPKDDRLRPIMLLPDRAVWERIMAYSNALRMMTSPEQNLDNRLRGIYGRHHVKALKTAIALAVGDWHLNGGGELKIELRHWLRAQQLAEEWRTSAHRFLKHISVNEDVETQKRVLAHLRRYPEGETKTELLERTRIRKNQLESALAILMESGEIQMLRRKTARGPEATVYQAL